MNPVFTARRRAEEFNSMVEQTTGLRDTGHFADLAPLAGLVTALRDAPAPRPRPEFVADLRTRLLLAAESALAPDTAGQSAARRAPAQPRTRRERRLAVAVGGFAILSASGSMAVAAQSSLPGDTLYPLKRAIENVHESAIRDADDKGSTMLGNASGRLAEVDELSRSGDQDPDVIAQTLEDFADQAVEASDLLLGVYAATGQPSSIDELRSFTEASLDALERLEVLVPPAARSSLIEAALVLGQIEQQLVDACPACVDLTATSAPVSSFRHLGPLFGDLLDQPLDRAAPADRGAPPKPRAASTPPAPAVDPVESDSHPDEQPPAEETDPPELPGDTEPRHDDVLDDIATGLGSDPIGDLLTGTLEVADELIGGGTTRPATQK